MVHSSGRENLRKQKPSYAIFQVLGALTVKFLAVQYAFLKHSKIFRNKLASVTSTNGVLRIPPPILLGNRTKYENLLSTCVAFFSRLLSTIEPLYAF
ncbi:hypothetical protein HOLleu_45231 [Holothuria leucospilota]|uniref:Uncharacterized protein n=1 Tax=Holothuria leucospilota TaxID=206669 RepID=A0A9Q0YCH6_HOLLE|nr:hypothetical protein HOLleu_45231 [Holothuria leucospilota]